MAAFMSGRAMRGGLARGQPAEAAPPILKRASRSRVGREVCGRLDPPPPGTSAWLHEIRERVAPHHPCRKCVAAV